MRRAFGIGLFVVLAFGVHVVLPSSAPVSDDYPLDVGMRWTYRAAGIAPGTRHVSRADGAYVEMKFDFKVRKKTLMMRRTKDGVVGCVEGREHLLMRFPMREGDRWTIDAPGEDRADCEVLASEEIDVLGKRVRCSKLRVTHVERSRGRKTVDHEWYAPGLGLVRFTLAGFVAYSLERFERAAP